MVPALTASLLFFAFSSKANEPAVIHAEQVHQMLGSDKVILIDNRPAPMFEAGHLPQALSMTYFEPGSPQNEMTRDMLEPFKGKKLIFYCSGANRAYHAGQKALEWGISSKVFWFKGGWPEWQEYTASIQNQTGEEP